MEREGEEAARRGVVVATMAVSGGQASDGILQTMTQRDADEDRGNLLMDREPDRMGAADDVTPARTFFVRMVALPITSIIGENVPNVRHPDAVEGVSNTACKNTMFSCRSVYPKQSTIAFIIFNTNIASRSTVPNKCTIGEYVHGVGLVIAYRYAGDEDGFVSNFSQITIVRISTEFSCFTYENV